MELLVALVGVGAIAGMALVGARAAKDSVQERRATWARIAKMHGGKHVVGFSDSTARYDRIEIPLGDRTLLVTEDQHPGMRGHWVRVTSILDGPLPVPDFRVFQQLDVLPGQDTALGGDARFDEFFAVKTSEAARVRRWWTPLAKDILFERIGFSAKMVECRNARFAIVLPRAAGEDAILAAIDLATELIHRDLFGVAALRSIDGSLRLSDGAVPVVELRRPRAVCVKPTVVDGRLITAVELMEDCRLATAPIVLRLPGHGSPPDLEAVVLPSAALPFVGRCGPGVLEVTPEGAVCVRFDDVVENPRALEAAVGLVNALCAPAQPTYR